MLPLPFVTRVRPDLSLPVMAVFGCAFTLATQLILMVEWTAGPYLIFWHLGKLFGFVSTICSGFIIQAVAPKIVLGYWNGRNEALTNAAAGVAPLIFATIYDAIGSARGQQMLACTSAVSLLATLSYAPLIGLMPKEKKEKDKPVLQDLSVYESMSDLDWSLVPMEIKDQVQGLQLAASKLPRVVAWGNYQDERPTLGNIHGRAVADFKYISASMLPVLSDREKMKEQQAQAKAFEDLMPAVDREKAKQTMGAWLADYLDDAGYPYWETHTQVYKAMIMSAFPPIDTLEGTKLDYASAPIDKYEEAMIKFLEVMNEHLAHEEKRLAKAITPGTLFHFLKRR